MSSRISPPSADTGGVPPGRRWTLIIAGIVLALIVIAGIIAITTTRSGSSDDTAVPAETTGPVPDPSDPFNTATTAPTSPGQEMDRCSLPPGDQTIPNTPIQGPTTWTLVNRVAVPGAPKFGPQRTDGDGLRRCFAQSPTGAVFAAYNHLVSMSPLDDANGDKAFSVMRRIMTAGVNRDRYFEFLKSQTSSGDTSSVQLVGFKVIDATNTRASILIAAQVAGRAGYASSTWTLAWQDNDWKVVAPRPGEMAGAPVTPLQDLTGFVPWRGV